MAQAEYSPPENAAYIKRSYLKGGAYAFVVMMALVLMGQLYPPFQGMSSYIQLVAYMIGGVAAGYYFSQDMELRKLQFQTRDGVMLWVVCMATLVAAAILGGVIARGMRGEAIISALSSILRSIFGGLSLANPMSLAWGLLLALLGVAMGHDIYHEQFTMLRPLSGEKRAEVREFTHTVQPLIEARHRYGRSFTPQQLTEVLPDQADWASMDETLSGLQDQGVLTMADGVITITGKGENLLSISRFVGRIEEVGGEGADLCAYCGRPLKLSDKLMRINYYGEPRLMHYAEREGVRIFGRLPYIDKVLGLKPAEVSRPVYGRAQVLATVDHKAALTLGVMGATFAMASYTWMMLNADSLPIPTEVSFFGGTLLSVSLIFAFCGVAGGLLTYLDPGRSYGGVLMLALIFFALPFVGLTAQAVFGGYYAAVGLIAVGGAISVKARTRIG